MDVEFESPAETWFLELDEPLQKRVTKIARQLEMQERGLLGTPYLKKLQNTDEDLYELVIDVKGHLLRPILAFEPGDDGECAVILVGGDKKGDDRYYEDMIPEAEAQLEAYRD
ncbi:MAG: type II toxin-antitoxin system RelE/ParE family toxin [Bradymonadaceae bacterium]